MCPINQKLECLIYYLFFYTVKVIRCLPIRAFFYFVKLLEILLPKCVFVACVSIF